MDGTTLGGVTSTLTYDSFNELSELRYEYQGTVLYAEDMQNGRDKLGRITQRTETKFGVPTTFDYEYDTAGRLDVVRKAGNVDADYDYGANGNRTEAVTGAGVFFGTYDDQDRLLTYGGNTYTYDANGDLETKLDSSGFTTTYDYDELGNLMSVDLPDGRVIDYIVDGRDRRVGKKIDGALEQGFLYRDQINPVAELDGLGQVAKRFVYGSRAHVPDYMVTAGRTYRLITDHLGSVRLVVDVSNGSVAQQLDYGPWGEVLQDTNRGFQPFGFAGGLYDQDTGLVRFGARDYDPDVGRWTTRDKLGFLAGDGNLYAYSFADPTNQIDPTGLYTPQVHESLLESAFGEGSGTYLTFGDRENLKSVQWAADADQRPHVQFRHAMRWPGVNAQQAIIQYQRFLDEMLDEAVCWERRGEHGLAMMYLGFGMHALMDNISPWHAGFQKWHGGDYRDLQHALEFLHSPSEGERSRSDRVLQKYYQDFQRRSRG